MYVSEFKGLSLSSIIFEFSWLLTIFICSWINNNNNPAHIISRLLIQYCIYSSYFSGSHSRSSLQQNPFHNCCCARVNFQSHHNRNKIFMKLHFKFSIIEKLSQCSRLDGVSGLRIVLQIDKHNASYYLKSQFLFRKLNWILKDIWPLYQLLNTVRAPL